MTAAGDAQATDAGRQVPFHDGQMPSRTITCPVCGLRVGLTKSGTVRRHGTYGSVCPQSGSEAPAASRSEASDG